MLQYGVMIAGFFALSAMMAADLRRVTVRALAGGIVVATAWFALCLCLAVGR